MIKADNFNFSLLVVDDVSSEIDEAMTKIKDKNTMVGKTNKDEKAKIRDDETENKIEVIHVSETNCDMLNINTGSFMLSDFDDSLDEVKVYNNALSLILFILLSISFLS